MQKASFGPRHALAACGLAVATAIGASAWQRDLPQRDRQPASEGARRHAHSLSEVFRHAAEIAVPTVVSIETKTNPREIPGNRNGDGRRGQQRINPFEGTPFEDFFNDDDMFGQFENTPDGFRRFTPRQQGMGSGVIIDKSGIVLTNNHVVRGADEVIVRLSDGREFKATDIKTDPDTDLAVLSIKAGEPLPAAELGDSGDLQVGDWVIAIGAPFGLSSTVSAGIISNSGRELQSSQRTRFLQTDATINPGNSGGPLVNLDGQVIGINTAIASNSGSFQGIGFAIPSNLARWVTSQLVESGSVQRGYLGVGIQETNSDLAEQFGIDRRQGVLVSEVLPDTPAAAAGLQPGDVITEYAGKLIRTPRDLQELVERSKLGSEQKLTVVRDGDQRELEVAVRALPETRRLVASSDGDQGDADRNRGAEDADDNQVGLQVADLTSDLAQQLGYEGREGVVITDVQRESPADLIGLDEGMLILRVGRQPVSNAKEFKEALQEESLEEGILLHVRTENGNRFVVLRQE